MNTDFHDRSGKDLYVGDLVQYRLSKNTGPITMQIVRMKHGFGFIDHRLVTDLNATYKAIRLSKTYETYLSLLDTSERL